MANRYQKDYTPTPVIYQGIKALSVVVPEIVQAEGVLDPSAGSGAFGAVARHVMPEAHVKGIEPRREEKWWLSRNYDEYEIGHFSHQEEKYDLVVTNPPFSAWEEFVVTALSCISDRGILMLLGLTAWGSRSIAGYHIFQQFRPAMQMRITGTVGFHGPGTGSDTRDYCWWVWSPLCGLPRKMGFWATFNLPRLPPQDRKWVMPPGRESGYGIEGIRTCEEEYLLQA